MTDVGGRLGAMPAGRWGRSQRFREVALHLTAREVSARRRFTLLGAAWPVARLLAQLGVLLFIFTTVVDLEVESYPVFLFTGLLAWTWFSTAVAQGTQSLLVQRHLLRQPQCPTTVIPLVAVGVALAEALVALPVLIAIAALTDGLGPAALALPLIGAVQLVLLAGLAWLAAAVTVYVRDVRELVAVGLTVLFYASPVFYSLDDVPDEYRWLLELNPMSTLIEAYRDVLIERQLPDLGALALVLAGAAVLTLAALAVFRRLAPGFVDEL